MGLAGFFYLGMIGVLFGGVVYAYSDSDLGQFVGLVVLTGGCIALVVVRFGGWPENLNIGWSGWLGPLVAMAGLIGWMVSMSRWGKGAAVVVFVCGSVLCRHAFQYAA